jgi:hypothetical protein
MSFHSNSGWSTHLRLKLGRPTQSQWTYEPKLTIVKFSYHSYPIIKRRIAWLIGKWVSDECAVANSMVWEVLVHLLQDRGPGTDAVVRLTAAVALRECANVCTIVSSACIHTTEYGTQQTIQFNADVFIPFLPVVVRELLQLIGETDTLESKRRIAQTLNTVIEQAHTAVIRICRLLKKC